MATVRTLCAAGCVHVYREVLAVINAGKVFFKTAKKCIFFVGLLTSLITKRCFDCWRSIANEWSYCVGEHNESIDDEWVPTGLQTISTHQYRDGEKLVTKQHILEEYETGVEAYYKNPGLKDSLAVCNDAFDNDDNLRTARSVQLDEQLRAKL